MSTKQNTKPSAVETTYLSPEAILEYTQQVAEVVAAESIARANCAEACSKLIPALHQAGVKVGRRNGKNPCTVAAMFYDSLISKGLSAKTASNYLTTFKTAVESGKAPTDWNKARKGKGKKKEAKAFAALMLPAFNHDEGKSFQKLCNEIESGYMDDKFDSIYKAFIDFLKKEGMEVSE